MTDLKDKTVEELLRGMAWDMELEPFDAFDELAHRIKEAQQKLERYTRRSESGESLGDHYDTLDALEEAQKQIVAQQVRLQDFKVKVFTYLVVRRESSEDYANLMAHAAIIQNDEAEANEALAAHDAETAAKALEESAGYIIRKYGPNSMKTDRHAAAEELLEKAAQFRAKAGRNE